MNHGLLTSTSKILKLLRSEDITCFTWRYCLTTCYWAHIQTQIVIFRSRTQRMLLMSHYLLLLPLTFIQFTKTAQSPSTSKSCLMDRSKIRRTCASRAQVMAQSPRPRPKDGKKVVEYSHQSIQLLPIPDSTGSHQKIRSDKIQYAITVATPPRRYAIGLPPNKLANNVWAAECSRS
jgi:hypothetical protein